MERTPAGLPDLEGEGWYATGGPDGLYPYRADQPKLVEGRLPPEGDPTGVAINSYSARRDGLGVGDTFAAMVFDVGAVARLEEPSSDAEARQLTDRYFTAVDLRVTGVYDRIEEVSGQSESADDGAVLVSRAFVAAQRRHVSYRVLAVDLREGTTPAELQAELRRRLPGRRFDALTSGDQVLDAVDRSVAPVVGALWVFAGLMAAAMVLVVGQVAARSARLEVVETSPLGALGMTRGDRVAATALRFGGRRHRRRRGGCRRRRGDLLVVPAGAGRAG